MGAGLDNTTIKNDVAFIAASLFSNVVALSGFQLKHQLLLSSVRTRGNTQDLSVIFGQFFPGTIRSSSRLGNGKVLSVVRHKMNQLGTRNFGAYARKMLIDGYIIKVDYTEQKKLAAAVSRIATNINHVCRRINSTGHFYDADVAELKERMADVWELLKVQQRNEL